MSYAMRKAGSLYSQTQVHGGVEGADRHQLIGMLLDALVERINRARGHILYKDIPAKGRVLSNAIAITAELRNSLNHTVAPKLTRRLDSLYDYLARRLLFAQLNDDTDALDECQRLIAPIREAWEGIRPGVAAAAPAKQAAR